jgi:hypothetical protein
VPWLETRSTPVQMILDPQPPLLRAPCAKGACRSSDIATRSLGMRSARCFIRIIPGASHSLPARPGDASHAASPWRRRAVALRPSPWSPPGGYKGKLVVAD